MNEDTKPLPENWSELDSHDCFFEYLKIVRAEVLAGKPLPEMFSSTHEEKER